MQASNASEDPLGGARTSRDDVNENGEGGGSASYRGYDYQKEVTAWVALTLFLERRSDALDQIIVEPASEEDIEADLNVSPDEATATVVVPAGTKLTVQVKFRGAGHWSAREFAELVLDKPRKGATGPTPRPRAKTLLLTDPARRYVLITNVTVDRALSPGRVERVDQAPSPSFVPPHVTRVSSEKEALQGRFAIVEGLTRRDLRNELHRQLRSIGHVPSPGIEQALQNILRIIEDRLLGLPSPLTRTEIEAIIQNAGGLPYPDRDLAEYREPANAAVARETLQRENAVLLIGPPGYGKSLTARRIVYEHQVDDPPFTVVRETEGIAGIDTLLGRPGRHVFFLEDPWGQARLDDDASRWTIELPKLLLRATADKRFVITSRTDILRRALGEGALKPWRKIACPISDDSYDVSTRWEIVKVKLRGGGSWMEDFAREHRDRILTELRSPYALARFARGLLDCPSLDDAKIGSLIAEAQVETIRSVVAEQVRGWASDGVPCAAITWALLRRGRRIVPARLKALQRALEEAPRPLEIDLEGFVEHFRPMNLHQADDGSLTAHGKVVEGLEDVVVLYRREAERTVGKAIHAIELLRDRDESYAGEILAFAEAADSIPRSTGFELAPDVRAIVDDLVVGRLVTAGPDDFARALNDVVFRASQERPLSRLARYLDLGQPEREDKEAVGFGYGWRPPQLNGAEISAIRSEPDAERIVAMWISHVLPLESTDYDARKLLAWLDPIGFDLRAAFLEGCQIVSETPRFLTNADTVVEGALHRPMPPYEAVFALLERWEESLDAVWDGRLKGRKAWQGEADFTEQLHLQDEMEELGTAVGHGVRGYVRSRRAAEGYAWIADHRRRDLLMPAWAEELRFAPDTTVEELDAYFEITSSAQEREQGLLIIGEKKLAAAAPRLHEALRTGSAREREMAVHSLRWLYDGSTVEAALMAAMAEVDLVGQIELFSAARKAGAHSQERRELMRRLQDVAQPESRGLLELLTLAEAKSSEDEIRAHAERVPPGTFSEVLRQVPLATGRLLLVLAALRGVDVTEISDRWLASTDVDDVRAAVSALAYIETPASRARVASAATNADYKVRRLVMEVLARSTDHQQLMRVLEFEHDASAPVRQRLATLIGEHRWPEGIPVLLRLLDDTRDSASHHAYDARWEPKLGVARAAAEALKGFDGLPDDALERIIGFVEEKKAASRDVEVHASLLHVLAPVDDSRVVPILGQLMNDDRVIGHHDEPLYPVRYAAGWALFHHLDLYPGDRDAVDWGQVERAAGHSDPQLAAPGLFLLGRELNAPTPGTLDVLRSHASEPRRALALMMVDDYATARSIAAKYEILPPDHPLFRDAPLVETSLPDDTHQTWPATTTMEAWLRALDMDRDVEGVLLKVAEARTGLDLGVTDYNATVLRRKERIPVVTLSEMFGME